MSETPYYISLEEAINITHKSPLSIETEQVSLDEAHGRILATDLSSKVNDPPPSHGWLRCTFRRYK